MSIKSIVQNQIYAAKNFKVKDVLKRMNNSQPQSPKDIISIERGQLTKSYDDGVIAGVVSIGTLAGIISLGLFNKQADATKDLTKQIQKLYENPDIRKDTFSVMDINKDKHPDIVFERKDGTKVYYDIKNNKLLEERTTTKLVDYKI